MLVRFSDDTAVPTTDFCVVGAGPAGIALSLALAGAGHSILLVESGYEKPIASFSELSQAEVRNMRTHSPVEIASCRALGGTSWWWGGRCVPFDRIDFDSRPYAPGTNWPVSYDEIKRWHSKAAAFFKCGSGEFKESSSACQHKQISCEELERWTPITSLKSHIREIVQAERITLLLGATLTNVELDPARKRVQTITLADEHRNRKIDVTTCVLACGGLETTRALLVANQKYPNIIDRSKCTLGRYYMGHISGKIADVVFDKPESATEFDFFLDRNHFARRRFTLRRATLNDEKVLNIAFWIDNPPFYNHDHRSGILSAVWLMLAVPFIGRLLLSEGVRISHVGHAPRQFTRHLVNVFRAPLSVIQSAFELLQERYLTNPRKPGFLVRNHSGRYALHYHGEHLPTESSSISLSSRADSLGVPRLAIDLRYSEADARSVVQAHRILDNALKEANVGHLEYRFPQDDLLSAVLTQASDGFHQLGTTRMSSDPSTGVVDANCKIYGIDNLFIASSSVFPSSSQANPTFMIVALALRLASHLVSRHVE